MAKLKRVSLALTILLLSTSFIESCRTKKTQASETLAVDAGIYTIKSRLSGKCLDVPSGLATDGLLLRQWDCNDQPAQKFEVIPTDTQYIRLQNVASKKTVDVKDSRTDNGAPIQQWPYLGGENQQFHLVQREGGTYAIIGRASGRVLDVVNKSTVSGAMIQQFQDFNTENQQWIFTKVETVTVNNTVAYPPVPMIQKFKNPILKAGADPWVTFKDGYYYYCYADGQQSIYVSKSRILSELATAVPKRIWLAPPNTPYSNATWAPELHFLKGKWYVYFAADNGANENHRMYVLEANSTDALGNYTLKGAIKTKNWAIDGTPLEMDGGKLYFVWSGWSKAVNTQQNLYVAPMLNPWTLDENVPFRQRLEAENSVIANAAVRDTAAASNGKVVGKFDVAESSLTFIVNAPGAGVFTLDLAYSNGSDGRASENITINGVDKINFQLPYTGWDNMQVWTQFVRLNAGRNEIKITKGDKFAEIDYIEVKTAGIDPVAISVPELAWERKGTPAINEGPQILKNGSKVMIIYSASGSWTDDYCLGQLTLSGPDPMNSLNWAKKGPVFQSGNDVWGPGHASFTKAVDGTDWIVYHAAKIKGSGWDRDVRTQPFTWNTDGSPNFGAPLPLSTELSIAIP